MCRQRGNEKHFRLQHNVGMWFVIQLSVGGLWLSTRLVVKYVVCG